MFILKSVSYFHSDLTPTERYIDTYSVWISYLNGYSRNKSLTRLERLAGTVFWSGRLLIIAPLACWWTGHVDGDKAGLKLADDSLLAPNYVFPIPANMGSIVMV